MSAFTTLTEGEDVGAHAWVKELDGESAVGDRALLTDQLVHPGF